MSTSPYVGTPLAFRARDIYPRFVTLNSWFFLIYTDLETISLRGCRFSHGDHDRVGSEAQHQALSFGEQVHHDAIFVFQP